MEKMVVGLSLKLDHESDHNAAANLPNTRIIQLNIASMGCRIVLTTLEYTVSSSVSSFLFFVRLIAGQSASNALIDAGQIGAINL